jgi:hypothetical protein
MSDFDDAIGDAIADLLAEAGTACVYIRGSSTASVTLRKSTLQPVIVDNGAGHLSEVQPVDFIGRTSQLPFDPPISGDRIKIGDESFEVNPLISEKCFRRISPQMTRIHCKRVA